MPTPINGPGPIVGALNQPLVPAAHVLPQPVLRRNGRETRYCPYQIFHAAIALMIALLLLSIGRASVAAPIQSLDWRFDPDKDLRMVRQTQDSPPLRTPAYQWSAPNPVVLPQPQWPNNKKNNRGWRLIDPAVGVAGVENADESRTAVRMAESGQNDLLSKNASTAPGQDELPGPLANIGLKVEMGVEYVF